MFIVEEDFANLCYSGMITLQRNSTWAADTSKVKAPIT